MTDVHLRVEPAHDEVFIRLAIKDMGWPAMAPAVDAHEAWMRGQRGEPAEPPRQVLIADQRTAASVASTGVYPGASRYHHAEVSRVSEPAENVAALDGSARGIRHVGRYECQQLARVVVADQIKDSAAYLSLPARLDLDIDRADAAINARADSRVP